MNTDIHSRIRQRLEILNLSPEAASRKAGLDRGYLQKLFERGGSPKADTLAKLAAALLVEPSELLATRTEQAPDIFFKDADGMTYIAEVKAAGSRPPEVPPRQTMPNDIPVMGTAAGSHDRGAFQFEGGVIDYVRRPPALVGARDIYALYVEGSSMEPQFWPGDLIYLHPHKPPRMGDAVVVQCKLSADSPEEATLGLYTRKTGDKVVIAKHNPKSEIELKRDLVMTIHKVLTINELFGV